MGKPTNLLDLMTAEDRQKALDNAKRRDEGLRQDGVTPEMYLVAEFGYYFGWGAVMAIRNNEITLDEVRVLTASARKVWYAQLVESAQATLVANTASHSKNIRSSFTKGMSFFVERMRVRS